MSDRTTHIGPDGFQCPDCDAVNRQVLIEVLPEPPNAPAGYGGAGRWRCIECGAAILDLEGELTIEGDERS